MSLLSIPIGPDAPVEVHAIIEIPRDTAHRIIRECHERHLGSSGRSGHGVSS